MPEPKRGGQGFTLLEILVAMAVLAVALPVLLANVTRDIALAAEGKFLVTASLLAQEKMAEWTGGGPPAAGSLQGDFGRDFPGYSWQLDVRDVDLPGTRNGGVVLRRLDLKIGSRFGGAYRYSLRRYLLVAGRGLAAGGAVFMSCSVHPARWRRVILPSAAAGREKTVRAATGAARTATGAGSARRATGTCIRESGGGFTLFEVLLAMAIFAVVAALAYSCYTGIVTAVHYTRQETAVYRQAAVAMQRIREDLQSAVVLDPADPDRVRGRELFQGESNTDGQPLQAALRFRTMARLGLDDGELIRESGLISYHAEPGGSGGGRLIRRDQGVPGAKNGGGVDGSLCEGLQEVRFRFLDAEGEGHSLWPPEALGEDEKTGPPAAVEVSLLFAGGRDRPPLLFRSTVPLPPAKWP